jgi:hypothetical protein
MKNGGDSDGNFNIIVSLKNATFSTLTEQPYTMKDNTTIIFPYLLHKTESILIPFFFKINKNVSGFTLEISAEKQSFFEIEKLNPLYPIKLTYRRSGSTNEFELSSPK